jgi:hypothetical protein
MITTLPTNRTSALNIRHILAVLLIGCSASSPALAEDIRIVCPYVGGLVNTETPSHGSYSLSLKGTGLLEGLFLQWIRPSTFQVNTFIYQSSNINYSDVWGGHIMGDIYFFTSKLGSLVAGAGSEFIFIYMDADSNAMPLTSGDYTSFGDFEMKNRVYTPFVRAGYRFTPKTGKIRFSLFPWVGVQYQGVRGRIAVDFPAFQYPQRADISSNDWYAMAGLGANANIFHFIDLEAKYHATFDKTTLYSTITAMVNVFITRHIGVSYRFKYMEQSMGSNTFHMGGIAIVF